MNAPTIGFGRGCGAGAVAAKSVELCSWMVAKPKLLAGAVFARLGLLRPESSPPSGWSPALAARLVAKYSRLSAAVVAFSEGKSRKAKGSGTARGVGSEYTDD
jgi:hypothetical protein